MNYAIEIENLTKSFGEVRAVHQVHLNLRQGEIFGFLGLNGAGKTTTIRLLLGLVRPSQGRIRVFGQNVGPYGTGPWDRVGHLVESPSAYPELSVRENLEIARRYNGTLNQAVVDEAMQRLSIAAYADKKAGTLSSGNLQRLGLARALLHNPELLILDEPVNGLDPAGVVEIRDLLKRLAFENGVTIFMSSHILTEVNRLATHIGIIHHGRLIEELDASALEKFRSRHLEVMTRDLNAAQTALQNAGIQVKLISDRILIERGSAVDRPEEIAGLLVRAGCPPTHLSLKQQDLEDHFLKLIGVGP